MVRRLGARAEAEERCLKASGVEEVLNCSALAEAGVLSCSASAEGVVVHCSWAVKAVVVAHL